MFLVLLALALFMAFPMGVIIGNAFKPLDELWVFPPKMWPSVPTLQNFRDMFNVMADSWVPFFRYIYNSLFITAVGTAGHIILASMCAFPLAKKKFPGRAILFNLIVFSLMFNTTVTAIPNYITMAKLGWVDTHLAIIVPGLRLLPGPVPDEAVHGTAARLLAGGGPHRRGFPVDDFLAHRDA